MTSERADELLYDSDRTRVSRIRSADGTGVIRKQPLGPEAADRLRNEIAVLRRLESVDGTPELAGDGTDGVLELVDAGGRTLAALDRPWATGALLDLALGLAEILAAIHRHGVVHRDVSPTNILVGTTTDRPMIIDFELATLPGATGGEGLAGTLPYLAPEQTGRTGRPVDNRSDLYSLGATLYELATGEPPFGRDRDALSLIHDHLAKVPVPPAEANPQVPALLSEIIRRLLHKEPDHRYQSAAGLAHDLTQLRAGTLTELGERDFPIRIAAPARLIGRDEPLAALRSLLAEVQNRSALALITGPPGVGKTALVDQLRPAVVAAGGRFVTGKFDQFHHHDTGGALGEAFERLGDLLLTETADVVAEVRGRLREALGEDAGLIAALLPSFRTLLDVDPEHSDDPRAVLSHLRKAGMTLLRIVANGAPLVFFLDDLQWATGLTFDYLDDVLANPDVPGLLVLGAYRQEEVDETHQLTAVLDRLRRERGDAGEIRLDNLTVGDLGVMIAEMLRVPEAGQLATVLAGRTRGNPFDTVELLNALRQEGVLVPQGGGWCWDTAAVRDFVGHGNVVALLTERIAALPEDTRAAVDLMACIGGDVPLELLGAPLTAAVDGGLVIMDDAVARFRHDRVQQAAFGRLSADQRARLSLSMARRLAPAPEAAPLYLAAADLVLVPGGAAPGERRAAGALLRKAAAAARLVANHVSAEEYLAVAVRLVDRIDEGYAETRAAWHAALCAVGRFDDADRLFTELTATVDDPVLLAGPAAEQVDTLTNRRMLPEAVALSLRTLTTLGIDVPAGPAEMGRRIAAGMDTFYTWLATAGDADRPEITDRRILAAAQVISRTGTAAYLSDRTTMVWLVARAAELWVEHGVCAALTAVLGGIGLVTITGSGDYTAAYRATLHVLATGVKHGHEPATSHVRFLHSLATAPWFEPLESSLRLTREARDGLLRSGDLTTVFHSYTATVIDVLDHSADLELFQQEMQKAEAFGKRIGCSTEDAVFTTADMLIQVLRGTGECDDTVVASLEGNNTGYVPAMIMRSLMAAVFGDDEALVQFSADTMRVLPTLPGIYLNAPAHLFAVLAAAVTARAGGAGREEALAALDRSRDFLAARAAGCPANFRHLSRLAEATRAAVRGDFTAAATAYDQAMADAVITGRSWHAPLITEQAARFYLDNGLEHLGIRLLAEALPGYARWGATAKVRALKRDHPALGAAPGAPGQSRSVTVGTSVNLSSEVIDLMAVLEAGRALSSETSIDRLRVRVQQVLGAMTGATTVHMVLHDDQTGHWVLPADGDRPDLTAQQAADQGLLPLTAIRYAERAREPMLIDDVSLDDRVNRDPYLTAFDHCSLLVVPVIGHGQPRAVLILENRLSRRAFSAGRLDAVLLVAGQLAVSLENAQVYASLERAVAERTEELAQANQRLELLTVTDPLTGLPNRRKLDTFLQEAWLRSERSREPISIAMVDIDNFKKYNDHYGHQAGDECLRKVATALRSDIRNTDLVTRYGGEEFCIVMPGATITHATIVANRACHAVTALQEPHHLTDNGIVTVSIGITTGTPLTHADPGQLQKLADEALYEAKRTGRNRVVSR